MDHDPAELVGELPGPVEALVVLNDAPLPLAGRILRNGSLVSSTDDVARVRYVSTTLRLFGDWDIHAQRHARDRLDAMAGDG